MCVCVCVRIYFLSLTMWLFQFRISQKISVLRYSVGILYVRLATLALHICMYLKKIHF